MKPAHAFLQYVYGGPGEIRTPVQDYFRLTSYDYTLASPKRLELLLTVLETVVLPITLERSIISFLKRALQ